MYKTAFRVMLLFLLSFGVPFCQYSKESTHIVYGFSRFFLIHFVTCLLLPELNGVLDTIIRCVLRHKLLAIIFQLTNIVYVSVLFLRDMLQHRPDRT